MRIPATSPKALSWRSGPCRRRQRMPSRRWRPALPKARDRSPTWCASSRIYWSAGGGGENNRLLRAAARADVKSAEDARAAIANIDQKLDANDTQLAHDFKDY